MVVMLNEGGDDRFGLRMIITVIVVALIACPAVEAFNDAIRLRVSGPRFDIDRVIRLNHRGGVAIDELTAMIMYNARFDAPSQRSSAVLHRANEALDDLRAGRFEGAAVLVP